METVKKTNVKSNKAIDNKINLEAINKAIESKSNRSGKVSSLYLFTKEEEEAQKENKRTKSKIRSKIRKQFENICKAFNSIEKENKATKKALLDQLGFSELMSNRFAKFEKGKKVYLDQFMNEGRGDKKLIQDFCDNFNKTFELK